MLFFFHRYELPAVLHATDPLIDLNQDDVPHMEHDAVMPDSESPSDDDNSSSSHQSEGSNPQGGSENSSAAGVTATATDENSNVSLTQSAKILPKRTEASCLQACASTLIS